jgi:hypothetical protein
MYGPLPWLTWGNQWNSQKEFFEKVCRRQVVVRQKPASFAAGDVCMGGCECWRISSRAVCACQRGAYVAQGDVDGVGPSAFIDSERAADESRGLRGGSVEVRT